MDFSFTGEQDLLRHSLRSFLSDRYSFSKRTTAQKSGAAWRPEIWRAFADDLGILNMSFPPRLGGLGVDAVTTMVVMEELGRALVVEPYLESIVCCGGLLSRVAGLRADELLRLIGDGDAVVAFAAAEPAARDDYGFVSTRAVREEAGWRLSGAKSVVVAAPFASHLLVTARTAGSDSDRAGISVFLVERTAQGLSYCDYPTVDGRQASDVVFDNVRVPTDALLGAEGQMLEIVESVIDETAVALCAEAVGVMSVMHSDTVAYAQQRRQFGQSIANFQVLQHRMVDMYIEIEMAQSATYLGTLKVKAEPKQRALAASAAKVTVSNACRFVGQNAIQLHGGMGMTDDLAVSHYFRRATVIERELGGVDFHLARYATLSRRVSGA